MATRGQSYPWTAKPISNISDKLVFFSPLDVTCVGKCVCGQRSLNIKSKFSVIAFSSCFACVYRQFPPHALSALFRYLIEYNEHRYEWIPEWVLLWGGRREVSSSDPSSDGAGESGRICHCARTPEMMKFKIPVLWLRLNLGAQPRTGLIPHCRIIGPG